MKRKILITGANGYIGSEFMKQLLTLRSWNVVAMSSRPDIVKCKFSSVDNIEVLSNDCLFTKTIPWSQISHVVHLAFARRFCPNSQIAESITFSKEVFAQACAANVEGIINLSSQSVYGNAQEVRNENTPISPEMVYSMAKYSTEILLSCIFEKNIFSKATNIRLDPVAGNQNLLPSLVKQACTTGKIQLTGGGQIFSLLDISDAAGALISLINTPTCQWKKVYNVGWNNKVYTLLELAELTKNRLEKFGYSNIKISLQKSDIRTYAGMDSTRFSQDTGWEPQYGIADIIDRVIQEYLEKNS